MGFKLRKLTVGLLSLVAVLAIYLLYGGISGTPPIDVGTDTESTDTVSDFNGDIGKIDKVAIGTVQVAEYVTRNSKTKEIEQIFGFERLIDQEGDQWQLQKPYIHFFQPDFTCRVTARTGTVRVETGPSGPTTKAGTFAGNVVINILPKNRSDNKEARVYLDDIAFVSEKSEFSTPGPLKFIAENAQMLGEGLEGAYNGKLERLEFLRIDHLESLHHKTSKADLFGLPKTETGSKAYPDGKVQTARPDKPAEFDDSQKPKLSPTATKPNVGPTQSRYYRCLFSKDVVIDSPELFVFAENEVSIKNILWARPSSEKSAEPQTGDTPDVNIPAPAGARQREPNQSSEQLIDVVVTCKNGILITPMDSARSLEDFTRLGAKPHPVNREVRRTFEDAAGRTTLIARNIDHCASTDETAVAGPLQLTFDINDPFGAKTNETTVPVKVTAQQARFLPASNQVVFNRDSVCTMLREDPNGRREYELSGRTLTIDLLKGEPAQSSAFAFDIKHLTAIGGIVRLSTIQKVEQELLGGLELKCRRFDFDADEQMFLATGPAGETKLYNSKVAEPNSAEDRFSLKKPCWAVIKNFDTLKFFLKTNRLVADAQPPHLLNINYFPIVDGQPRYDQQLVATARHLEALLHETADGEFELLTLTATGGVHYEEEGIEFDGSELFYDAEKHIATVHGDQSWPCFYNGVPVDNIEYDLRTKRVKTEVLGPGALQTKD